MEPSNLDITAELALKLKSPHWRSQRPFLHNDLDTSDVILMFETKLLIAQQIEVYTGVVEFEQHVQGRMGAMDVAAAAL